MPRGGEKFRTGMKRKSQRRPAQRSLGKAGSDRRPATNADGPSNRHAEPLDTPLTDYLTGLHPIDWLIESHPERHGSPGTACAILRRAGECDRFASVRCDLPRLRARLQLRSLWPAPISCGSTWITSLTSPEATCFFQSPGTACVPHPRAGHFLWIAYYDVPPIDVRQLTSVNSPKCSWE